ncbi:hypothetical protein L612_007200000030, partial [Rhodococcus rhodochrous J38]
MPVAARRPSASPISQLPRRPKSGRDRPRPTRSAGACLLQRPLACPLRPSPVPRTAPCPWDTSDGDANGGTNVHPRHRCAQSCRCQDRQALSDTENNLIENRVAELHDDPSQVARTYDVAGFCNRSPVEVGYMRLPWPALLGEVAARRTSGSELSLPLATRSVRRGAATFGLLVRGLVLVWRLRRRVGWVRRVRSAPVYPNSSPTSAASVNLCPVTADTPTGCGMSATASVNLDR